MHESDLKAFNTIDAAVFNGDSYNDPENMAYIRRMLHRWTLRLDETEKNLIDNAREDAEREESE